MAELLVTPDVVALLVLWLRATLPEIPDQPTVPVHRSVPSPRPNTFVTVRLLGGAGREGVGALDAVSVAIEAWAMTVTGAHDLAQNARAVVHAAQGAALGGTQIYRVVDAGAPVDLPDPVSNQPRYTFTVELLVRTRPVP